MLRFCYDRVTVTAVSVREQRRRRAREAVADAGMRLFVERGFDATTVDEIAEAAGVSPRTVFRYFGTKDEIVFAADAAHLTRFLEIVERRTGGRPHLRLLAEAMVEFAAVLERDRAELTRRAALVRANPRLFARQALLCREWREAVARRLAGGDRWVASDPNVRMAAATAVTAIWEAVEDWVAHTDPPPLADVVRRFVEGAARTVAAPQPAM